jgi:hypothetical protein
MKKKNFLIFSSFFFPLLLAAGFVFARELEVPLPSIGGEGITETPLLPDYVKYLFNFAIGIAGLIAFISAVYGGFKHLISAGSPSAMEDANDQIFAGVLGLVVIIGSWLILTTINPQLVIINPQIVESGLVDQKAPGIYLCQTEDEKSCEVFTQSSSYIGTKASNAKILKIVNPTQCISNTSNCQTAADCKKPECNQITDRYGVVLHGDKNYRGKCAVYTDTNVPISTYSINDIGGVNSITVFLQSDSASGQGVALYEKEDYNQRCGPECYLQCPFGRTGGQCGDKGCYCWGPSVIRSSEDITGDKNGKSISVDGDYMAVLFQYPDYKGVCGVFTTNNPNMADTAIGVCGNIFTSDVACFGSILILPVK